MTNEPRLTFAIPFYRGRAYLQRAIASVLGQRYPHWQLLVCDDCGPETGIADLVCGYADARIRYYRNDVNLGMAGNWNRCLDLAETDLVNLLHADDELLDGYAETMVQAAADHPTAVGFFCNTRIIDEQGRERFSFPDFVKQFLKRAGNGPLVLQGRPALESLLHGNFIMCPTICYRKSILRERRFQGTWQFVQDFELFTRLLLEGDTLVGFPTTAYAYRRHAHNATTAYTENLLRFAEETQLYEQLGQAAAARRWPRMARIARRKVIVKLNVLYCATSDLVHGRPRQAWQKAAFLGKLCSPGRASFLPSLESKSL